MEQKPKGLDGLVWQISEAEKDGDFGAEMEQNNKVGSRFGYYPAVGFYLQRGNTISIGDS